MGLYGLSEANSISAKRTSLNAFARYITDWYGIELVLWKGVSAADVILVEEKDVPFVMEPHQFAGSDGRPALIVLCSNATRHSQAQADMSETRIKGIVEFVAKPCGPYKLAKALRSCITTLKTLRAGPPKTNGYAQVPDTQPIGTDGLVEHLQELELEPLDEKGLPTVVMANEIYVVSEVSQNAQMAINDRSKDSELDAQGHKEFSFPGADEGDASESSNNISAASRLPRLRASSKTLEAPRDTGVTSSALAPHVLLVDDNRINLNLLGAYMKKRKYDFVDAAEDGLEALNLVTSTAIPYDIIFMDISMPVMNGFEATRAIRGFEANMRRGGSSMIIALTGLASGRDQSEGFAAGCDIYMTKPVSFREMGKLLDNWEASKRATSESTSKATEAP